MSQFTLSAALERLGHADFARVLEEPGFDVGLYKPDGVDTQSPHARDELYVIASGQGAFEHAGKTAPVAVGDVLFVAAGEPHRFIDFSSDFSAWVIFIGPRPD